MGWGISPGPPLFNYINIYLYLCVPVWGAGGICQRPTVLLYLTILHKGSKCVLPQPEHESPAHSFLTARTVCLSVSVCLPLLFPSPSTYQGIHRRVKDTPSQSPRGLCYQSQDTDQQPLRSGSLLPRLQEEGLQFAQLSETVSHK